ncbi:MAG TPA: hypothetical protein VMT19_07925 [Thermoanaerobaculaceae bacterium]|nr:hypothetical protein [Thermoanaerobaculaceae bacterium]
MCGSYGHFRVQIPMDLVIRSVSHVRQLTVYRDGPTDSNPDPNAGVDLGQTSQILGRLTEPANPRVLGTA